MIISPDKIVRIATEAFEITIQDELSLINKKIKDAANKGEFSVKLTIPSKFYSRVREQFDKVE